MKGHTLIQLTDVSTGKVEKFEDDNMITNAIQKFLCGLGVFATSNGLNAAGVALNPLWQTYLGGIMLFDKKLEENIENVIAPADVIMVGNGSYGVSNNSDTVQEMGTWNSTESGLQEDGSLKLVWDFATDQANGTIQSVCLGSSYGCYIGMGNKNVASLTKVHTINNNAISELINSIPRVGDDTILYDIINYKEGGDAKCFIYADYESNIVKFVRPDTIHYRSDRNPENNMYKIGKIIIDTYRFGLSAIDIREYNKISQLLQTDFIDVPEEIRNYLGDNCTYNKIEVCANSDSIYFIFIKNRTIKPSEYFYVMKVDSLLNVTSHKIVNNSTTNISTQEYKIGITDNEYLIVQSNVTDFPIFKISIKDSTDVTIIENVSKKSIEFGFCIKNKMYCNSDGKNICINTEQNKTSYMNGFDIINGGAKQVLIRGNDLLVAFVKDNYFRIYRNCGYLATINNLKEPVEKTASKTMKITYSITFD